MASSGDAPSFLDVGVAEHAFAGLVSSQDLGVPSGSAACSDVSEAYAAIVREVHEQRFAQALELLDATPEHWITRDRYGHSLIHWAALLGNEPFVESALANNCQVDSRAENQQTPLMWAVVRGHVAVVRQLLAAEADIRRADSLGATPLMIAVQHTCGTRYQLMLLLMQRGGHELLCAIDYKGCTAGHWAAYKGDLTALKLLVDFEADIHVLDDSKMSLLHRAVFAQKANVVPYLLEMRSDPLQRNAEGKTSVDLARNHPFLQDLLTISPQEYRSLLVGNSASLDRDEAIKSLDCGQPSTVETLLNDSSASWLVPYYQYAMDTILDAVGQDTRRTAQDLEPLVGASAPGPLRGLTGVYGNDGL